MNSHLRLWDYLPTLPGETIDPEQDLRSGQNGDQGNEKQEPEHGDENEDQDENGEDGLDLDFDFDEFQEDLPNLEDFGIDETGIETNNEIPGFSITINPGTGAEEYLREFDSWTEFVHSAANDPYGWSQKGDLRYQSSHRIETGETFEENWHGTRTFDEALEMALSRGWPEGRALLSDSLLALPPRPQAFDSQEFDVAGAFPCVPLYNAGDPACMFTIGNSIQATNPVIRIDYNNWITRKVSPQDMMLRGAAVLSLAYDLESQGLSTELRIVGNSQGTRDRKVFRYSIIYKKAGENLDLDRAAFALAHPSTMRRLALAILEQHKELEYSFHGNYGRPMFQPNDPSSGKPGGAIFVPGSRGRETLEGAQAAVTEAAQKILSSEAT